jgi:hypothetical protein
MDVWFVQSEGLGTHRVDEIDALLRRTDGFTWIDVPQWDEAAERLLPTLSSATRWCSAPAPGATACRPCTVMTGTC